MSHWSDSWPMIKSSACSGAVKLCKWQLHTRKSSTNHANDSLIPGSQVSVKDQLLLLLNREQAVGYKQAVQRLLSLSFALAILAGLISRAMSGIESTALLDYGSEDQTLG